MYILMDVTCTHTLEEQSKNDDDGTAQMPCDPERCEPNGEG